MTSESKEDDGTIRVIELEGAIEAVVRSGYILVNMGGAGPQF
jgi:hypothetical protein